MAPIPGWCVSSVLLLRSQAGERLTDPLDLSRGILLSHEYVSPSSHHVSTMLNPISSSHHMDELANYSSYRTLLTGTLTADSYPDSQSIIFYIDCWWIEDRYPKGRLHGYHCVALLQRLFVPLLYIAFKLNTLNTTESSPRCTGAPEIHWMATEGAWYM